MIYLLIFLNQLMAQPTDGLREAVQNVSSEQEAKDLQTYLSESSFEEMTNVTREFEYTFCYGTEYAQCDRLIQYHFFGSQFGESNFYNVVLHYSAFYDLDTHQITTSESHSDQEAGWLDQHSFKFIQPVLEKFAKKYDGATDVLRSKPAFHPFSITKIDLGSQGELISLDDGTWQMNEKFLISFAEMLYSRVFFASWSYNYIIEVESIGDEIEVKSITEMK